MRVAVKAVTNRVQLRTIITYDFMLYGRRFQGAGSVGQLSLTSSTKTRLAIVAHSPRSKEAYSVLLHQMTTLENQRAPCPAATWATWPELRSNLREMESSVSDDNIPTSTPSPFGSSKSICTSESGHLRQRNLL